MKTLILTTLTLFMGLTVFSQYADPPGDNPGVLFQMNKESLKNFQQKNADKPVRTGKTVRKIQPLAQPGSIDPTWVERFQTVLDSVWTNNNAHGLSAAVLVPGEGLWTGASGYSSDTVPITTEMRFGIASNTKLYIAVTLAKLQELGILSLDDHLYQWLPAFAHVDSTATIRQLLSHQSGIFDFWNDNATAFWNMILADTSHFWTPEEVLATIGNPHFVPGHGYSYSNTNYTLAALIIEAATDTSCVQKLHDIVFDPQVMDSTFVGARESRNGPVAHEWAWSVGEIVNSPMTSAYSALGFAGNILSTPQEMVQWYSALFGGGILSESSLKQVVTTDPTSTYGLGIMDHEYLGHHFYEHDGANIGDLSEMVYDIQTKSVFCIMTNSRENFNLGDLIAPMMEVLWNEYPRKPNDAGITKIINPWENSCSNSLTPSVILKNFGSQALTSADIHYRIDVGNVTTFHWTGALNSDDSAIVIMTTVPEDPGFHTFTCYTSNPNGLPEGYTYNDTLRSNFFVNQVTTTLDSLGESFEGPQFPPPGWVVNTNSVYNWGRTSLAKFNGNYAAVRNNWNDPGVGNIYHLNLPFIHISSGTSPLLSFRYAYAMYPGAFGDTLQVQISTDCGITWQSLFKKGGQNLQTVSSLTGPFYPQTAGQWKHVSIPLEAYPGDALIRFREVNGWSNILYLDDIHIGSSTGISEHNPDAFLIIYPNPASQEISISGLPLHSAIRITDLTGKLLITRQTTDELTTMDISQLSQGVYFVRTILGVRKIVKM